MLAPGLPGTRGEVCWPPAYRAPGSGCAGPRLTGHPGAGGATLAYQAPGASVPAPPYQAPGGRRGSPFRGLLPRRGHVPLRRSAAGLPPAHPFTVGLPVGRERTWRPTPVGEPVPAWPSVVRTGWRLRAQRGAGGGRRALPFPLPTAGSHPNQPLTAADNHPNQPLPAADSRAASHPRSLCGQLTHPPLML
ncbi:hypothetical protein GCM10010252_00620 [Streptomyces aureoverticillatus]|nr:hypothetical protein GCM10010252_00620 [Streptomyces aureoverticillatus]